MALIQLRIAAVNQQSAKDRFLILLRAKDTGSCLPVWVSAQYIPFLQQEMAGKGTTELKSAIHQVTGVDYGVAVVRSVEIVFRDGAFRGQLRVEQGSLLAEHECPLALALALGLRLDLDVLADASILDKGLSLP